MLLAAVPSKSEMRPDFQPHEECEETLESFRCTLLLDHFVAIFCRYHRKISLKECSQSATLIDVE